MNEIKMLDHQKIILENVKQDSRLFEKELKKSLNWLNDRDKKELYHWVKSEFWTVHKEIIQQVFEKSAA